MIDEDISGVCDCGFLYKISSRFDHDADLGLCWDCSPRKLGDMNSDELDAYLRGD